MEEKILSELFKQYGMSGLAIFWLIWKEIKPQWKKYRGDYVSWEDIKNQQDRTSDHVKYLEQKVGDHLLKEAQEDIVIAEIKSEQNHLRELFNDMKDRFDKLEFHQQKSFDLISEIKNHLIK